MTRDEFYSTVAAAIERSRLEVPANWQGLLDEITTTKGRFRLLKKARKGAGNEAYYLLSLIRWHGGSTGGNLTGLMMARMALGAAFDSVDTLAMLFRHSAGLPLSPSARKWADILGSRS